MKKSILSLSLVLALLLSGCGLRPAGTAAENSPPPPSEDVYSFRFSNATGQDIYAVSFREATVSEDYTENILSPGLVLRDGDWMELSFDCSEAKKAFESRETAENGAELTMEYRMLIVLKDGRHYELSAFPLGDMEDCTVLLADNAAYISYVSLCTQQLISTKEAELAIYERWGRQSRDISALVSYLPSEPVPTAAVETPAPEKTEEISQVTQDDGESDPNEGCLTGGLFY